MHHLSLSRLLGRAALLLVVVPSMRAAYATTGGRLVVGALRVDPDCHLPPHSGNLAMR